MRISLFSLCAAACAAALCVAQALPLALNMSSSGCRSREYAVDEAVKHASGQQYCECVCPANAPWRCDCSGLVSRAWGLGAPGLTTYDFNPNYCEKLGSRSELQPADSLLWPGVESQGTGHVLMFVKWIDKVRSNVEAKCQIRALWGSNRPVTASEYVHRKAVLMLTSFAERWSLRGGCLPQSINWMHAWPAAFELLWRLLLPLPCALTHYLPLSDNIQKLFACDVILPPLAFEGMQGYTAVCSVHILSLSSL